MYEVFGKGKGRTEKGGWGAGGEARPSLLCVGYSIRSVSFPSLVSVGIVAFMSCVGAFAEIATKYRFCFCGWRVKSRGG